MEEHLTGKELAGHLKLHRNTMSKLINRGEFPNAFRIERDWRIPVSDVEAWIERQRIKSQPENRKWHRTSAPDKATTPNRSTSTHRPLTTTPPAGCGSA